MSEPINVIVVDPGPSGEPLIDAGRIREILLDCLYRDDEIAADMEIPDGAILVEGIIDRFGLHPDRLESHRDEVHTMLCNLPEQFQSDKGGGWSFLQACDDRNGVQWTGLHQTMGDLFVLGIGLGLAKYILPREMWPALPGGMPYLVVEPRS
jgi:hypothetical protein